MQLTKRVKKFGPSYNPIYPNGLKRVELVDTAGQMHVYEHVVEVSYQLRGMLVQIIKADGTIGEWNTDYMTYMDIKEDVDDTY